SARFDWKSGGGPAPALLHQLQLGLAALAGGVLPDGGLGGHRIFRQRVFGDRVQGPLRASGTDGGGGRARRLGDGVEVHRPAAFTVDGRGHERDLLGNVLVIQHAAAVGAGHDVDRRPGHHGGVGGAGERQGGVDAVVGDVQVVYGQRHVVAVLQH